MIATLFVLNALASPLPLAAAPEDKFHLEGSPNVTGIDEAVEAVMKANGVHAASLAIVQGTRLVYTKGYAYGPSKPTIGAPVVKEVYPTTMFRQASVSKFVTALAAMQCIEEGLFGLDTTVQSILGATTPDGKAPVDPQFSKMTIRDLLEMRAGLDESVPFEDLGIKAANNSHLPVTIPQIIKYAAANNLAYKAGDKSHAGYNNACFAFLGYCVAKVRQRPLLISALQGPLLMPLKISRIVDSRSLKADQLPDEATYTPNPFATAKSVMSDDQPTVEQGYGETNLASGEGSGGLSAAATDMARILACLNMDHPTIFKNAGTYPSMLRMSWDCFQDPKMAKGAFGFYGLDGCQPIDIGKGLFSGDKGGYLSTSQNGIYFERGGLGYVVNWAGHTPSGEAWYPYFNSVFSAAKAHDWGDVDLFPKYGMPPLEGIHLVLPPGGFKPTLPTRPLDKTLPKGRLKGIGGS